ncbi:MAG: DMT family transporter [Amaricoccus sp.]|uniref:DMT family transporter n=1 Tax=Amaricoccus sp. TaxID=1872485 RepID=UPI0039E52BBF
MILVTAIFAGQDAVSRHLAQHYSVMTVVMLRYWVFALFVVMLAARRPGGLRAAARSRRPGLQIFRSVLLVAEICVTVVSFVVLGLIGTHAIFAVFPLLVAALAGPVLGEPVGWRRKAAIAVGLVGVLVILRPGFHVFSPQALIPLLAAFMFALYSLLTRMVARWDSAETSFFYTGVAGAVAITLVAPFWWTPIHGTADWAFMASLCVTSILGHFLLIKVYEVAEAGTVQPFAYFQLLFVTILAVTLFGERPDTWTVAGAALILAAGLYAVLREAQVAGALRRN